MRYLKTNRVFSTLKKWTWLFIPIVAVGGLFIPKLGLLLIPMMLSLLVLGFFRGKYWCGNYCPHASLFDHLLLPFAPLKKIPKFVKTRLARGLFFGFYMFMFMRRIMAIVSLWGTLDFWDKLGFIFAVNYLMPTLLGSALALLVNPRAWCSFCPMGTMQILAYRLGQVTNLNFKTDERITITDLDQCRACGKCARVCPMQLEPYKHFDPYNQFADEACIKCGVCAANCPFGLLTLQKVSEGRKQTA